MKETSAGQEGRGGGERERDKASLAKIMLAPITHIARSRDVDRNERTRPIIMRSHASQPGIPHRFLSAVYTVSVI